MSRQIPAGAPRAVKVTARAIDNFVRHEMSIYAAALAYRGLLALFPFIIFVLALINVLDVWRLFDMLLDWARTAPEGRVPTAIRQWAVAQARGQPESTVLSVGAMAAIWAVASGTRVLRSALNIAAEKPEAQSAWVRVGISFVTAPVLGALLLLALSLFMVTQRVVLSTTRAFALNDAVVALWDWVRVPAGIVLAGIVIAALYRFAPSHRQSLKTVMPGTLLAAAVWAGASLIFSRTVSALLQFGVTYGSFSAAIVLLVYLYFAAAGLLFGAELNAVLVSERPDGNGFAQRRAP